MRSITIAALIAASSGALAGDTYSWDWTGPGGSDRGGAMSSINSTYNTSTEVFRWEANFSNQISDGFTLAVNAGANPKGIRGELALIYFDATGSDVNVTAYEYNGQNNITSFANPGVLLNQSGDADFIRTATATNNADGTRTFVLEFDATTINSFYETEDWGGVAFDESIGVWFHPFKNLNTAYDNNGMLTQWSGSQGWLDFADQYTTSIPMPAAGAMGFAGLGLVAGRRRR